MCTVTYIPIDNEHFVFTSNRDESPMRKTIPPKEYIENGVKMIYPKDELAGGTWIGLSEKNRLVCLLNGGFEKHHRNSYYRMSRGIIVKKLLQVDNPVETIKEFDFENIEPFTIVLIDWSTALNAYELVWDGENKHFNSLENQPKIWSSSTLYDADTKQERIAWFNDWLVNESMNQDDILQFHQDTKRGTEGTSLKMKRPFVETVSITSIKKEKDIVEMKYLDLLYQKETFLVV
jgi:hypothetical protein